MTTHLFPHQEERIIPWDPTPASPSIMTELGYYLYLSYTLLGAAFGLFVSNLGSGFLVVLLVLCLLQLRSRFLTVIGLAVFPLSCAITYIFIQHVLHEEPLMGTVRSFMLWAISLLIVQSLSFRRNFLHRFALVVLFLGIAFIPFIRVFEQGGGYQRMGLERAVGYANPNSMAEWYGFCVVYFAILGMTTHRNTVRLLTWVASAGCLYMVTIAVSRGTLFAISVAVLIAGRHLVKNGIVPILLLACITAIVVELGVFGEAVRSYGTRGTEETGRFAVWPLIFESFIASPLIGVGETHIGAMVGAGRYLTPHNCFLFIAQASGIIPLVLFVCYWVRAASVTFRENAKSSSDAPFHIPLLIYTLLFVQAGDFDFMMPVAVVAVATVMNGCTTYPCSLVVTTTDRERLGLGLQEA